MTRCFAGAACLLAACTGGTITVSSTGGTTGHSMGSSFSGSTSHSAGSSSGTTGSSGGSSGAANYEAFCQGYPQVACAAEQGCGLTDPAVNCATTPSVTDCQSSSSYAYDAQQGEACLSLLRSATGASVCTSPAVFGFEPDGGSPCSAAVQPGVAWGGACDTAAGQCIPPSDGGAVYCLAAPGTCGGTCGLGAAAGEPCVLGGCADGYCELTFGLCQPYAPLGEECTHNHTACDPSSMYCIFPPDGGFGRQFCTPLVQTGGLCFVDGCYAGEACVSPDGGYLTYCEPQAGEGEACSEAVVGPCQTGLTCFDGSCAPYPAALGGACGLAGTSALGCASGYCDNPDGGVGVCTAQGGMGSPCVASLQCGSGLACVAGTCAPFSVPLGSSCTGAQVCANGYCTAASGGSGTCTAFVAAGQACTSNVECAFPTLCVSGTCANPPTAGHPCASAGSAFFPAGCAYGDICVGGTCTALAPLGASCQLLPGGSTCANGRCDGTGHCAAFLATGAICSPTQFECSSLLKGVGLADGGASGRDAACVLPPDGGASVCAAICE